LLEAGKPTGEPVNERRQLRVRQSAVDPPVLLRGVYVEVLAAEDDL
jgi:hypothetical protein